MTLSGLVEAESVIDGCHQRGYVQVLLMDEYSFDVLHHEFDDAVFDDAG